MAVLWPKNLGGGHGHSREPVAVFRVESMWRIQEFFKGNQMRKSPEAEAQF